MGGSGRVDRRAGLTLGTIVVIMTEQCVVWPHDLYAIVSTMVVGGAGMLLAMDCPDCDWLFSPRKDGKVPKHAGAGTNAWGLGSQQVYCGKSGEPAAHHGLRNPMRGNSRTMQCAGCGRRCKRSSRDSRIDTHQYRGRTEST